MDGRPSLIINGGQVSILQNGSRLSIVRRGSGLSIDDKNGVEGGKDAENRSILRNYGSTATAKASKANNPSQTSKNQFSSHI